MLVEHGIKADATNNKNVLGSVVWTLVQDLGRFAESPHYNAFS